MLHIENAWPKLLGLIVACAFLFSLSYSFYYQIPPLVDARAYDSIARNIAAGAGYRLQTDVSVANDNAIVYGGPGYQFFLAGIYYFFGYRIELVWIVQAMLHALSALFVFLISRHIFRDLWHPVIGLVAAALIAFSPDLILASSMILTENFSIFLMVTALYFVFLSIMQSSYAYSGFAGFFLGMAFLTRVPFGIFILPIYLLYSLFGQRRSSFIFFIIFLAVCTPWTIRNYQMFHAFIPTNLQLGSNLLAGNFSGATGELVEMPYELTAPYDEFDRVSADRMMLRDAMSYIISHPVHFLKLTAYRASMYFAFSRPTGWWFHLSGLEQLATAAASVLYSMVLFVLGFTGLIKAVRDSRGYGEYRSRVLAWSVMLFSMPLSIIFIIVETRYRYPAYPFLAVFAGYAAYWLWRDHAVAVRPLIIASLVLLVNTGFDVLRNASRILGRISGAE